MSAKRKKPKFKVEPEPQSPEFVDDENDEDYLPEDAVAADDVKCQVIIKEKRHRRFSEGWYLKVPSIKDWIQPIASNYEQAWCMYCKQTMRAHLSDIRKHDDSNKHKKHMKLTIAQDVEDRIIPQDVEDSDGEFVSGQNPTKKLKRSKGPRKRCRRFVLDWLDLPGIKEWIEPIKLHPTYAWCKFCEKKIRAHLSDLKIHSRSKKHRRNSPYQNASLDAEDYNEGSPDEDNKDILDISRDGDLENSDNEPRNEDEDDESGPGENYDVIYQKKINGEDRDGRRRKFNEKWLELPDIKDWIHPINLNPGAATVWCKYCNTKLRAHLADLKIHSRSKKHQKNIINTITIKYPSQNTGKNSEEVIVVPVHQADGVSSRTNNINDQLVIPATIGFIGFGNMGQCLMKAFLSKGLIDPNLIRASAPSNRNLVKAPLGMLTTHDNNQVVQKSDIIFLCVKPHQLVEVVRELEPLERNHDPLFISIVVGLEIQCLEEMLSSLIDAPRVVRAVANIPCSIGQGCCVYTMGRHTNEDDARVVQSMFCAVGFCSEVPENQIDAVNGLAASGPAFIYTIIEALSDGAVKMGLPQYLTQDLSAHTVKGAACMLLETEKHPGQLKDEVCSPGGPTIAAMHTLENSSFRGKLISAIEASTMSSKKFGLLYNS